MLEKIENISVDTQSSIRSRMKDFYEKIQALPGTVGKNPYPLRHRFADGLYIREITVPADAVTVTARHKKENVTVVLKGKLSILDQDGTKVVEAPALFVTPAGTQRVIYHHTEVILTTIHANPTGETDIEKLEAEIFAFDFDEPEDTTIIDVTPREVSA